MSTISRSVIRRCRPRFVVVVHCSPLTASSIRAWAVWQVEPISHRYATRISESSSCRSRPTATPSDPDGNSLLNAFWFSVVRARTIRQKSVVFWFIVKPHNVRDHRAGISDHPFQKHTQVRLRAHHIVMPPASATGSNVGERPDVVSKSILQLSRVDSCNNTANVLVWN